VTKETVLTRRLVLWGAICAAPLGFGTPSYPISVPWVIAVPAGAAAGALLYAVLAAGTLPLTIRRTRAGAVVMRSAYLFGRSAVEEVVWRGYVFTGLALGVGTPTAFVATVALFAIAHRPGQGRLWIVHLVTGATFTTVFATTGSLAASVAAHATYNVVVGLAVEGARGRSAAAVPASIALLEGVVKSFGATTALAGVDLELREGEIVALLGPNGAGKTTAVGILLGLRQPDAGRALLFGCNPRDPPARAGVGAMTQEVGFPWPLSVREIVELVRAHFEHPVPTADLLERFSLGAIAQRQAGGLSGGQKRRLAVALAFAGRPRLLVLDEPSAGLDVETRRAFWSHVRKHADEGATVLLTTHHLEEAETLASRVVVLDHGRILLEGSPSEISASVGLAQVRLRAGGLPPLPGTTSVARAGDRYTIYTADADAVVAELVARNVSFADLEVTRVGLEEAFVRLTGSDR
jgi:ABC-2 type transport system ATP-binding protein